MCQQRHPKSQQQVERRSFPKLKRDNALPVLSQRTGKEKQGRSQDQPTQIGLKPRDYGFADRELCHAGFLDANQWTGFLCLAFHKNNVFCYFLKGVVVADHKELTKGFNSSDRFCQAFPARLVHIGRWLIEECHVDVCQHPQ